MSRASLRSIVDLPPPSALRVPRPSRGDGWNTLADIEVFVFAVEAELEAMDRERVGVHCRGRKPDPALRRRLIGLIWTLTFGGLQWRVAGWLSGVPFTTLHSSFARWTRLGLWRRLGQRLALDWRLACGDEVLPSAVVADSRSLRSAPTAWTRGIDGGKLVKGVKLFAVCDKHGLLLDLELQPANTDDRAGVLPMLPRLAALGFEGDLLGDSGFKGAPFGAAALKHDIHVSIEPPRVCRSVGCTMLPDWLATLWRRWWRTVAAWGWNAKHHLHLSAVDLNTAHYRPDDVMSAVPVDPVKAVAYSCREILKARQD